MTKKAIGKDNSGFSLVELIIAVAILAFVIGPILYSFIVANKVSNRSLVMGDATLVSRNVIERIRVDGVNDALSNVKDGISPFGGSVDTAYPNHYINEDAGTYEFLIRDIPAGTLDNTNISASADFTYDAVVRIDTHPHKNPLFNPDLNPGDPGYEPPLLNDLLITEYTPMDGMFIQDRDPMSDPDVLALDELAYRSGLDVADIAGSFNREIRLDAKIEGTDAVVTVTYIYTFTHPTTGTPIAVESSNPSDPYFDPTNPHPPIVYEYPEIYRDTYDPAYPVVIYMYYRPNYAYNTYTSPSTMLPSIVGGIYRDTINIYNNQMPNLNLTVFAIKQKPVDFETIDPGDRNMREDNYKALINRIVHTNEYNNYNSDPNSRRTKVYSNFHQHFDGDTPILSNFPQQFCRMNKNNIAPPGGPGSVTFFDDLVSQTAKDRVFSIHIEVYRQWSPTAELMLEFDATHLE